MHFYEFLSEKKTSGKGCAINVSLGDIFFHIWMKFYGAVCCKTGFFPGKCFFLQIQQLDTPPM